MYMDCEFKTIYWAIKGVGGADISWTCSVIYQNVSLIRGINVSVFCSNQRQVIYVSPCQLVVPQTCLWTMMLLSFY